MQRFVQEALKAELAVETDSGFSVGITQVRLGRDSHKILKHHANWRQQAINSLEREDAGDLHYSAVVSLSKTDALRLKDAMLETLENI